MPSLGLKVHTRDWLVSRVHWGLALIFLTPLYVGSLLTKHPLLLVATESLLAPLSILVYLRVKKRKAFGFGFLVGLGMFYWSALSFRYSDYSFLVPLMIALVALCYGGVFYLLCWHSSPIYRVLSLWLASYIHPFGFDWFVPESFFAYSVFKVDKLSFLCIASAIALLSSQAEGERFLFLKSHTHFYTKFLASFLLALSMDWQPKGIPSILPPMQVVTTHIAQDVKWQQAHLDTIVAQNFQTIQKAIVAHKSIVILPETAFPFVLNTSEVLSDLLTLSNKITIITGALYKKGNLIYNSTYIFHNNAYDYAHKVILAPFGETMPLPKFLANYLDSIFFGPSAFQLGSGETFRDFNIAGLNFRPLVCYEGTSAQAYPYSPQIFIVISNNGWFVPSIEPFLQRMLLKYYARRFHKIIIHSTNLSPSYILTPTLLGDQNKDF